jgi:hypothetical protein
VADSFDLAYLYGRVCGSFSEAFLGAKGAALAGVNDITSLWKSVFGDSPPDLPEAPLIVLAEKRVIRRALARFERLAAPFSDGDIFIAALRRKIEFADVKRILAALHAGLPKPGDLVLGSGETGYNPDAWPDPDAMFKGSRYAWIDQDEVKRIATAENRLDRQYYLELWASLHSIPKARLGAIRELIVRELVLQNLVWALRLRRYYGYGRDDASPLFARLPGVDVESPALSCFGIDIDNPASWTAWEWAPLLGGAGATGPLDVGHFETSAQGELHRSVRKALHLHPFTYTPLYCYFKLAESEAALILGMLEGIRLGAPLQERMAHAWALAGEVA